MMRKVEPPQPTSRDRHAAVQPGERVEDSGRPSESVPSAPPPHRRRQGTGNGGPVWLRHVAHAPQYGPAPAWEVPLQMVGLVWSRLVTGTLTALLQAGRHVHGKVVIDLWGSSFHSGDGPSCCDGKPASRLAPAPWWASLNKPPSTSPETASSPAVSHKAAPRPPTAAAAPSTSGPMA